MILHLSLAEEDAVNTFLCKPNVKKILSDGGRWALVFGPATGIGLPVEVTAQSADGLVTIRQDVTDVSCW